ncbi:MAG: ribonuclease HII [Rhodoglobus sp.]
MPVVDPTLEWEHRLFSEGARYVIGCDEVGRGAIAGPVAVGMSVVGPESGEPPPGLRDSKMLSEKRREALAPAAQSWSLQSVVGLAAAAEVDAVGIMAALGLAGKRALVLLHEAGVSISHSTVLLDGSYDWLSPALRTPLPVRTRPKADRDCASVAAASVISKVHRDRLMIEADADLPGYGWKSNKGYGSVGHFAAIASLGATEWHRHTWLHNRTAVVAR